MQNLKLSVVQGAEEESSDTNPLDRLVAYNEDFNFICRKFFFFCTIICFLHEYCCRNWLSEDTLTHKAGSE